MRSNLNAVIQGQLCFREKFMYIYTAQAFMHTVLNFFIIFNVARQTRITDFRNKRLAWNRVLPIQRTYNSQALSKTRMFARQIKSIHFLITLQGS